MENATVNFNMSEASFNSTAESIGLFIRLEMCMFSINFLFGLPTHSYVLWLIITESGITSGFFILNLSVCEIGNCLNCLLSLFGFCPWLSSISAFLSGLSVTGRPLFQCLICVERYLAVVHPVTFLKFKPLRYRVICCTAAWIISLGSCLFCMNCLVYYILFMWFFSVQFLFFLCIQLFCCVAVLRALKQSETHMKRRAFNIILITTVTMVVIYVPFTIFGFFYILTQQNLPQLSFVSVFSFLLGGFVQPVLYLHQARKLSYTSCNLQL